jgi:hypothetical protein
MGSSRAPCGLLIYPYGYAYPRLRTAGVSEASYYIGKRNKGSQMGHTKKIFKKERQKDINTERQKDRKIK